jgi:hypothetical protein
LCFVVSSGFKVAVAVVVFDSDFTAGDVVVFYSVFDAIDVISPIDVLDLTLLIGSTT